MVKLHNARLSPKRREINSVAFLKVAMNQYKKAMAIISLVLASSVFGLLGFSWLSYLTRDNDGDQKKLLITSLERHSGGRINLAFSPKGDLLASGDSEGLINVWELSSSTALYTLKVPNSVLSLAISDDGHMLASGSYVTKALGDVNIWNLRDSTLIESFRKTAPWSVRFTCDGRKLVAGGPPVIIWDIHDKKEIANLSQPKNLVSFTDLIAKTNLLAIGTSEGKPLHGLKLMVFDWSTMDRKNEFDLPEASTYAFSPDGTLLATDTLGGKIELRDWQQGRLVGTIETQIGNIMSICFSPDGCKLAVGGVHSFGELGGIFLCDIKALKKICEIRAHLGGVESVAWSPAGQVLATGGLYDSVVNLWDVFKAVE
jgi:WD40 repeat protein